MGYVYWILILTVAHVFIEWVCAARRGIQARKKKLVTSPIQLHELPFVSVIIPAWQESISLGDCLDSIKHVDYPYWETVIVAGGPDGTYQLAQEASIDSPSMRVIEQLPRGKNAALNQGYWEAQGEVIVLLDADTQVSKEWLINLVSPLENDITAVTGNAYPRRPTPVSLTELMERISAYEIHGSVILQGSGSIAITRKAIDKIGGFPEEVLVGVDWDLSCRLANNGMQFAYCRGAKVFTERPSTVSEYFKNEVRWRRAHLGFQISLLKKIFPDLIKSIKTLYIYILPWAVLLFGLTAWINFQQGSVLLLTIWCIGLPWILLRRISIVFEVAFFTYDASWFMLIWVPPLLLLVMFLAIMKASLSLNRQSAHFKGPRPNS